ncbi:MAG: hypothetical protein CMP48_14080 [Rickettsiales bacterium]|nr:hypothetical protein [Rickettsiales bacterium]
MRIIRTIFLLTLLNLANPSFGQQKFLNELGTEKAESFIKLVNSYEQFLQLNYPTIEGKGERTRAFMLQLIEGQDPFKYDSLNAVQIINELEQSGLRKDIFLYVGEVYEPPYNIEQFFPDREVQVDTSEIDDDFGGDGFDEYLESITNELTEEQKRINEERDRKREENRIWQLENTADGLYHYALLKSDTSLSVYCEIRYYGLTPAITQTLLDFPTDELEDWRVQLPFVVDYYFGNILFRYRRHIKQATNKR